MMNNKELLSVAIKQIGNNGTKYRNYVGVGGNYCNMFVYWLFNANGCGSLLPFPKANNGRTYCPTSIKWCKKNLAQLPPYLAMPCDPIYFDWEPNGNPNHIGIVESKVSTSEIKTIEGNTSGKKNGKAVSGIVARKTRNTKYVQGVFRPHFKPPKAITKHKLKIDGDFGFNSIYMLQVALGGLTTDGVLGIKTVKRLQQVAGCTQDGCWQKGTSRAVQNLIGAKQDGDFGPASVKALQTWINKKAFPSSSSGGTATAPSVTKPATPKPSKQAEKAVAWARSIAKGGKYTYKKFNNKDKKTKQCPICHKLTGKYKGWNCIGFVSACWYHGAGLKQIKCACNGIGTDSFFTKVTAKSWADRNGKGWQMIGNGSKGGADIPASQLIAGDTLICYDGSGKFHHIALYTGNGKYIDDTNTTTPHIAERPYTRLTNKYHVTRAFRYVG